jgi:hypothetical protein
MINKEVIIDKIEVIENGGVLIRRATRIIDDGVVLSSTYHRSSLAPGRDVSDQDPRVQAICNAVWTPEVIAAFEASRLAALQASAS